MTQQQTMYDTRLLEEIVLEKGWNFIPKMIKQLGMSTEPSEIITITPIRKVTFNQVKHIMLPNILGYTFNPSKMTHALILFHKNKFPETIIECLGYAERLISDKRNGLKTPNKFTEEMETLISHTKLIHDQFKASVKESTNQPYIRFDKIFSNMDGLFILDESANNVLKMSKYIKTIPPKVADVSDINNKLLHDIQYDNAYVGEESKKYLKSVLKSIAEAISLAGVMFVLADSIFKLNVEIEKAIKQSLEAKLIQEKSMDFYLNGFQSNIDQPLMIPMFDDSITVRDFVKVAKSANKFIYGIRLEVLTLKKFYPDDEDSIDWGDAKLPANYNVIMSHLSLFRSMVTECYNAMVDINTIDTNIKREASYQTGTFNASIELKGKFHEIQGPLNEIQGLFENIQKNDSFYTLVDNIEVTKYSLKTHVELRKPYAMVMLLKAIYKLYKHTVEPLDIVLTNMVVEENKK